MRMCCFSFMALNRADDLSANCWWYKTCEKLSLFFTWEDWEKQYLLLSMFTFILFQTPFATCRFMTTSISDILQDIQKGEHAVAIKHFVTETSFSLMYIEYDSYYMADCRDTKYLLSIEKHFTSLPGSLVKYFSIRKEKLHISKWSCIVLFII